MPRAGAGQFRPTSGRALLGGHDIQTHPVEAKRLLSYIPDFPFLYDKLSPQEILVLVSSIAYWMLHTGYRMRK